MEDIPDPPTREIVGIGRAKLGRLFGGRLPSRGFRTTLGWRSGRLYMRGAIESFLATGLLKLVTARSAKRFWDGMRLCLFDLTKTPEGCYAYAAPDPQVERLIAGAIAYTEFWHDLADIPEGRRELVALAREKAIELFGGQLPERGLRTADGWSSGYLIGSPIKAFLADGTIAYSESKTPFRFWQDLRDVLLNVEVTITGDYRHLARTPSVERLVEKAVAGAEDWLPLDATPIENRALLERARQKAIEVFGGRLKENATRHFLATGEIAYDNVTTPRKFWGDLRSFLFAVTRLPNGRLKSTRTSREDESLISYTIAAIEKWTPLPAIAEDLRELVSCAREKAVWLFGGRLPPTGFSTDDGWTSGKLNRCPVAAFLRDGKIFYPTKYPPRRFWRNLRELLLEVEFTKDGEYTRVPISATMESLITRAIAYWEDWTPLEDILIDRRALVALARRRVAILFGGRLPPHGFETTDGFSSGELQRSPIDEFIRDGTVCYYVGRTPPARFWSHLLDVVFGVTIDSLGRYVRISPPARVAQMMDVLRKRGEAAWNARGTNRSVIHPLSDLAAEETVATGVSDSTHNGTANGNGFNGGNGAWKFSHLQRLREALSSIGINGNPFTPSQSLFRFEDELEGAVRAVINANILISDATDEELLRRIRLLAHFLKAYPEYTRILGTMAFLTSYLGHESDDHAMRLVKIRMQTVLARQRLTEKQKSRRMKRFL